MRSARHLTHKGKFYSHAYLFTFVCPHGGGQAKLASLYMWKPENSQEEPALSFPHVGPKDQTQVVGSGGKHILPAEPLASLSSSKPTLSDPN